MVVRSAFGVAGVLYFGGIDVVFVVGVGCAVDDRAVCDFDEFFAGGEFNGRGGVRLVFDGDRFSVVEGCVAGCLVEGGYVCGAGSSGAERGFYGAVVEGFAVPVMDGEADLVEVCAYDAETGSGALVGL